MRLFLFLLAGLLGGLLAPLAGRAQTYFNNRYATPGQSSFAGAVLPTDSGYFVCGETTVRGSGVYAMQVRLLDR